MVSFCDTFSEFDITNTLSVATPLVCIVIPEPENPFDDRNTDPAFPELLASSCVSSVLVLEVIKITPLDDIEVLPCSLEVPPVIPINPDQRDTLFPAVTPKLTTLRYQSRGCVPFAAGEGIENAEIGSDSNSTDPLVDDGWSKPGADSQQVVQSVTIMTRMGFDTTNGLYAFYRTYKYNSCGELISISPETAKQVEEVAPCTGE